MLGWVGQAELPRVAGVRQMTLDGALQDIESMTGL